MCMWRGGVGRTGLWVLEAPGGECMLGGWVGAGVQGVMEATALGKNLFINLVVRAGSVQYLFPDGSGTNKVSREPED